MRTSLVFSFLFLLLTSCGGGSGSSVEKNTVKISTSQGDMVVKLYDETPAHRDNFLKLAEEGFFDGTLFHRVIKGFMIQGGDPDSKNAKPDARLGTGGPGYTLPAEFLENKFHKKGALSAARLGDNRNPKKESSGSQFYVVQGKTYLDEQLDAMQITDPERRKVYKEIGGTPHLDGSYTVFGEVIQGLDVIDKIAAVKTRPGDRPMQDVKMTVKVLSK